MLRKRTKNEAEMKKLGMKITAQDIYDANKPGIKDAVPQFNGGCTAEMISPKGLLLTNHHCGFGQIQEHSSVEHDYLTDGQQAVMQIIFVGLLTYLRAAAAVVIRSER